MSTATKQDEHEPPMIELVTPTKTHVPIFNPVTSSDELNPTKWTEDEYEYETDFQVESQRGWFFCGFALFSPDSLLPKDPKPFTSLDGTPLGQSLESVQVPNDSWEWFWHTWYADMTGDVDDQGWLYSWRFSSKHWHGRHLPFRSFVRQRRWRRVRRRPLAALEEPIVAEDFADNGTAISDSASKLIVEVRRSTSVKRHPTKKRPKDQKELQRPTSMITVSNGRNSSEIESLFGNSNHASVSTYDGSFLDVPTRSDSLSSPLTLTDTTGSGLMRHKSKIIRGAERSAEKGAAIGKLARNEISAAAKTTAKTAVKTATNIKNSGKQDNYSDDEEFYESKSHLNRNNNTPAFSTSVDHAAVKRMVKQAKRDQDALRRERRNPQSTRGLIDLLAVCRNDREKTTAIIKFLQVLPGSEQLIIAAARDILNEFTFPASKQLTIQKLRHENQNSVADAFEEALN